MTGYESKRAAAQDKLAQPAQEPWCMKMNGCNTKCEDCPDEAALAQPEQEPVAWIQKDMECDDFDPDSMTCEKPNIGADGWEWIPLYTTPPQRPWVSLTDDQIKEIVGPWGDTPIKGYTRKLIDQIDAKLRENNT
jgi:hypothetical protein